MPENYGDIVNEAAERTSQRLKSEIADICSHNIAVVPRGMTGQNYQKHTVRSCSDVLEYTLNELDMWAYNQDWQALYGDVNLPNIQQIRARLHREATHQLRSIREYAKDYCQKEWGTIPKYSPFGKESPKEARPFEEFFEEENIAHQEYLTENVADVQVRIQAADNCYSNVNSVIRRYLNGIRHLAPFFDFF